jgi:hypothetical protein
MTPCLPAFPACLSCLLFLPAFPACISCLPFLPAFPACLSCLQIDKNKLLVAELSEYLPGNRAGLTPGVVRVRHRTASLTRQLPAVHVLQHAVGTLTGAAGGTLHALHCYKASLPHCAPLVLT